MLEGDHGPLIKNTAKLAAALEKVARRQPIRPHLMAKFWFHNTMFKPGQLAQKSTDKS